MSQKENNPMQRVLYAVAMDPERFASYEEQIFMLTRRCTERGEVFLPLFICDHQYETPPIYEAAGLRAVCLDLHRFRLAYLRHLLKIIKQYRIEIIHWNFTHHFNNPYLWALKLLTPGIRHYFTNHNSGGNRPPPGKLVGLVKKFLFNRYDRVFGVSQFTSDSLHRQGCTRNLSTLLHFMNTNRFKPDPTQREQMRSEYGATDNFIVLIVAYLVHEKGVDIVIKALSLLPEGINLWIVGGGKEYDNLHELCHKLKVAHRVRFFGHQQDIQRFTQAADCFVCPSRWEEAAGLVLLEAQSSGLPTLGSCRGGIPEYISDGNTGYLFRPEDEKQLAAQIRLLYENPLLYHKLQTEARAWVYRNFSHETQLDNYLHIYARDITG